jgi:hypothetical protein
MIGWIILGIAGFGVLCRVRQYAANTSLWHDESFVALNVIHTELGSLLGARDWDEPSPPGFLLIEKLMVAAFGPSEYTLRLLPHLAGLAALVLFVALAGGITRRQGAWCWAVALFALSDALIAQTSLVKHFTFDLLFSVTFVLLALRVHRAPDPTRVLLAWGALGSLAPWLSYASVFCFGGTSLVLSCTHFRVWGRQPRLVFVGANLGVLVSFVLLLASIRLQRTETVLDFWSATFPDTNSVTALLYWLVRTHLGLYHYLPQPVRALGPIFAVAGTVWYWRHQRRAELLLLWAPVGLALGASSLHYWPFGGNQHMSFAAPAVILTVAAGIDATVPRLRRRHAHAPIAAAVVLLFPSFVNCAYRMAVPRQRHELRPVIDFVQQHRRPGDRLLVFDAATFAFYTGADLRKQPLDAPDDAPVWVITPRSKRGALHPHVADVIASLDRWRPRLETIEVYGAAAYRFGPADDQRGGARRPGRVRRLSDHAGGALPPARLGVRTT